MSFAHVGSTPTPGTKIFVKNFWVRGESQLLGFRWEENAGAMFRHQAKPRGGGQPEPSDGEARGEADSHPGH
ncbi:MAG: hypothetical protein PHU56_03665 [Candidatus Pacebacteria bacterium]|nr:hypothetical protein [Candidatus Paceibacterota bacterium]